MFVQIDRACAATGFWYARNGKSDPLRTPASSELDQDLILCTTARRRAIRYDHQVPQNGNSGSNTTTSCVAFVAGHCSRASSRFLLFNAMARTVT